MRGGFRVAAAVAAALFFALHLPFLPKSLEDLDSVNFALGVRDFDIARHQPHPPGYPLFIVAAKAINTLVGSEAYALSLLGIFSGALAVPILLALFTELSWSRWGRPSGLPDDGEPNQIRQSYGGPPKPSALAVAAVAICITCPLFWLTASRPLSDMTGLAAALAVQLLILRTRSVQSLALVAFCAGLTTGIRSQVIWLTAPLLLLQIARMTDIGRVRALGVALGGGMAGVLAWLVPLVIVSGGPAAYWRLFSIQGAEDLSGVAMLATSPTIRQLVQVVRYTFLAPWGELPVALVVLAAAVVGALWVLWRDRRGGLFLVAAFGPYAVFDVLFQETITTRYALPIVVPMAFLAARGLSLAGHRVLIVLVAVLATFNGTIAVRNLQAYAQEPAPAFRMIAEMQGTAELGVTRRVVALHRKQEFDFRRPFEWTGGESRLFDKHLLSPPKHEWLELVKYWNDGGRDPVWFIADPLRTDLALIERSQTPATYRWKLDHPVLLGGARPSEMDWYVFGLPGWYLGEGWALTPEAAGVSREDGRGRGRGPVTGWIRRHQRALTLMLGGRNFDPSGSARLLTEIDGHPVDDRVVAPGFFLHMLTLPPDALAGSGDFAQITLHASPAAGSAAAADVALEQFDAQPVGRPVLGFGPGWHEFEHNPATGATWHWTTEQAILRIRGAERGMLLDLRGATETFNRPSHVVVRVGERVLDERDVDESFSYQVLLPAGVLGPEETEVTIETDQIYVPAEQRFSRTQDRRHLGLKIFEAALRPAS